MMHRREFLYTPLAAAVSWGHAPRLGEILFCRVSHKSLLRLVPHGSIAEVDPASDGLTFLGSRATLVVDRNGWRLFPAHEASLLP